MLFDKATQVRLSLILFFVVLTSIATAQRRTHNPHKPDVEQWEALVPQIQVELARHQMVCETPAKWVPRILDATDITGDGVPEALVSWCNGGAYTEWIVLMQLEKGEPVLAKFHNANGSSELGGEFLQGASVMHGADARLDENEKAVYSFCYDFEGIDDTTGTLKVQNCAVVAYVWSDKYKAFVLNARMGKAKSRAYCSDMKP